MSVRQIGQPRPSSRTRSAHLEHNRWCPHHPWRLLLLANSNGHLVLDYLTSYVHTVHCKRYENYNIYFKFCFTAFSCLSFSQRAFSTVASPGQTKRGRQYGWGMERGVPSQSLGRVWGYNLKLISTLHNDSIPETPSGKSGVDVSTSVHPVATLLIFDGAIFSCLAFSVAPTFTKRRTIIKCRWSHLS